MRVIRTLARIFFHDPTDDKTTRQLVYRLKEIAASKDAWDQKIVEMADGRSVGEIIASLYGEELAHGAQIVDIGMWKHLFDQTVVAKIGDLAHRGYIRVKPNEVAMEDKDVGRLKAA